MIGMSQAADLKWREVPERAIALAEASKDFYKKFAEDSLALPHEGFRETWYNPETKEAVLRFDWNSQPDVIDQWLKAAAEYATPLLDFKVTLFAEPNFAKISARSDVAKHFFQKQANPLSVFSKATGLARGWIPGAPNPLIGTIAGGLLGAGAGYGTGYLVNKFMPETERWGLKKRLAIFGGLLGASPGAFAGLANMLQNKPYWSPHSLTSPAGEARRAAEASRTNPLPSDVVPDSRGNDFINIGPRDQMQSVPLPGGNVTPPSADTKFREDWAPIFPDYFPGKETRASYGLDWVSEHPDYAFDAHQFNRDIWEDPRVANRLSGQTQAAASGLITGASQINGGARWVTPSDVGRIAAGMGSGYVSGALVGKALGVLMGMPTDVQDKLKNAGMWAGAIKNLMPIAFNVFR